MSAYNNVRFIKKGDKIITPGIDWGHTGLHIVYEHGKYMIIKNPGHLEWLGVGMGQYYVSTSYKLVETKAGTEKGTFFFTVLEEITPKRKWKKAIQELKTAIPK